MGPRRAALTRAVRGPAALLASSGPARGLLRSGPWHCPSARLLCGLQRQGWFSPGPGAALGGGSAGAEELAGPQGARGGRGGLRVSAHGLTPPPEATWGRQGRRPAAVPAVTSAGRERGAASGLRVAAACGRAAGRRRNPLSPAASPFEGQSTALGLRSRPVSAGGAPPPLFVGSRGGKGRPQWAPGVPGPACFPPSSEGRLLSPLASVPACCLGKERSLCLKAS